MLWWLQVWGMNMAAGQQPMASTGTMKHLQVPTAEGFHSLHFCPYFVFKIPMMERRLHSNQTDGRKLKLLLFVMEDGIDLSTDHERQLLESLCNALSVQCGPSRDRWRYLRWQDKSHPNNLGAGHGIRRKAMNLEESFSPTKETD